jgi:amino acid transporter
VTAGPPRTFRKSLGRFELVSLGLGGTIGSGIFVVPGIAAGIAGPASLLGWLVVGVSACSVAFALGAVQSRSPSGTAFTDLFRPAFGAHAAAAIVTLYLAGAVLGIATIAAGIGQYLSYFAVPVARLVEVSAIGAFLVVNLAGIAFSGSIENVLSVFKILAIVAITLALAPFVETRQLLPTRAIRFPELLQVVVIVYWPFTGFEISAIPVSETREPGRIPWALLTVMLLVCVVYLGLNVSLIGAVGAERLAASRAPVADAIGRVFAGAGPAVAVVALVTMASALNAYIVAASRVLQNAAEAFRVPSLAALSPRGVPAAALFAVCAGAAALLLVSNRFASLATAAVLSTLVPYIAICVAAFVRVRSWGVRAVALLGTLTTAGILVLYLSP